MTSAVNTNDDDDEDFAYGAPACFSMMAAFSNDDDDDDNSGNEAEQDSLAASNALVGENLLDSPIPKQKTMKRGYSSNSSSNDLLPPLPMAPTSSMHRPSSSSNGGGDGLSVGFMAHGLAWVQRTKESRRRRYLQHLAEQQLLKLKTAQEIQDQQDAAAAAAVTPAYSQGLAQNSTFQSIMSVPGAIHSNKSNHLSNHHASQTLSSLHDANGSGKRKVFDASDQSEEMDMGAVVSQSGSGYSFNLALSEKEHEEENADFIPPVRVEDEPDLDVQPFILNQVEMQQIAKHVLPTGIAYCKWIRLYSLVRDGDSFDACLRLVQDHVRTLMVVRTSRNQIMGGFADNAWKVDSGAASYYGGPEACLFKIVKDNDNESRVKAYKWTGRNRYIQLCDHAHKMLAFGGGGEEGAFGLSVEQDFLLGSTGPCATFDNEPLCDQDTFEIVDLEIYGYLIGQF